MNLKVILIFSIILISNHASANVEKVIYGIDNRQDIYQSTNPLFKEIARSTAAMISTSSLSSQGEEILIEGKTLEEGDGVCKSERFSNQIAAANCSGFLIADQYIVTAGHCIENMSDCEKYSWVFDYANINSENEKYLLPKNNIYKCVSIEERSLDNRTDNDYALIKLDRKVTDRAPLKFRKRSKIANNTSLVVIGHPTGLPTKIADGSTVRNNNNKYYFVANLDTFGGNSGSAVFDASTGVVEGILVRGEKDYMSDSTGCLRPVICSMTGCRGEDVTRITNIKALKKL